MFVILIMMNDNNKTLLIIMMICRAVVTGRDATKIHFKLYPVEFIKAPLLNDN